METKTKNTQLDLNDKTVWNGSVLFVFIFAVIQFDAEKIWTMIFPLCFVVYFIVSKKEKPTKICCNISHLSFQSLPWFLRLIRFLWSVHRVFFLCCGLYVSLDKSKKNWNDFDVTNLNRCLLIVKCLKWNQNKNKKTTELRIESNFEN